MTGQKVAIIDLDSVAFTIGHPNKVLDGFGEPMRTEDNSKFIYQDKTEDELKQAADSVMDMILSNGEFTHYVAYIKGVNTVHEKRSVDSEYKADRHKESPKWWNFVKQYLIDKWGAVRADNYEVDDYVRATSLFIPNSHIVAIDSDLLSLEGIHYNWRKNEWMTVSRETACYIFWKNMIAGTHNNTKGIPKKGEKFVEKLFDGQSDDKYIHLVMGAYLSHFGEVDGIHEFYKNFVCTKIKDRIPEHESRIELIKFNKERIDVIRGMEDW